MKPTQAAGSASPNAKTFFETSVISLRDVMELYQRDPTCKSSVDLLGASTVGMGFYTTCEQGQEKAKEAVDVFCEDVNLDRLLNDMAKPLIACGNDFWLKLTPERLADLVRLPIDAVGKIKLGSVYPGESVSRTVYVKNTGNTPIALSMTTGAWSPLVAEGQLSVSWDREGSSLSAVESASAVLTLSVSSSVHDVASFSVNVVITGSG